MNPRRWLGLILASILLVGCATVISPHVSVKKGITLTPAEQAEVAAIETALMRLCASFKPTECNTYTLPRVIVQSNDSKLIAYYDPNTNQIWLAQVFLGRPAFRPAAAHEIAHAVYKEANIHFCHPILQCEIAANVLGVQVLEVGWGYDHPTAVTMMYRFLRAIAANPKHVNKNGHDACRELIEFQRQLGVTNELPETCQGKAS